MGEPSERARELVRLIRTARRVGGQYLPEREAALLLDAFAGAQWQPIESAPKDGRLILLYPSRCWDESVNSDCEVGYWDEYEEAWGAATSTKADDYFGPTHWMPLPAQPEGKDSK